MLETLVLPTSAHSTTWPFDTNNRNPKDTQHVVEWLEKCNSKEDVRALETKDFDGGQSSVHQQNASNGNQQDVVPKEKTFPLSHVGSSSTDNGTDTNM